MRHRNRSWLAALRAGAAVVLWAASAQAQVASPPVATATLRVVATSPNGAATEAVTQATIRFSEPMVALGAPDADRVSFVEITPAVAVRYRWAETHILVVSPESGRFPFATAFEVRLAATATATAASGRQLAAPHVFRFSTPAPRLLDASLASVEVTPPESGVSLRFDQPVRAAGLAPRIAIAIGGPSSPLPRLSPAARARMARVDPTGLRQFDDWIAGERRRLAPRPLRASILPERPDESRAVLRLAETPPRGASVIVTATGIPSAEGPLRQPAPERRVVSRPRLFTVTGPECAGPCDPLLAALTLSIGLRERDDVRAAVTLTDITDPRAARELPRPAGTAPPWFMTMVSFRDLGYRLTPGRRYAVRVAPSLTSYDGERLAAPWMSVFDVGLPFSVAGLGTDADVAVWEAANGPRVPVLSRSLLDVRTSVAAVALPPPVSPPPSPPRRPPLVVTAAPRPVDGSEQEVFVDLSPALSPRGSGFVQLSVEPGQEAARAANDTVVVRPGGHRTTTVVQVTNIGVTVRGNGAGLVVLATRLDTGAPIAAAAVSVFDETRAIVWRGRTGADGLAFVQPADRASHGSAASILVEKDGDAAFMPPGEGWLTGSEAWLVGSVTTDRGVYRPGERVEVKAWLRLATPRGLTPLAPGNEVTLTWSADDETKRVLTSTVGMAGGAAWSLLLPDDVKVDAYERLDVTRAGDDDQPVSGSFLIKAVRPVEFQVTLSAELSASLTPPTIEARLQARDLSSVALAAAPVEWRVTRQPLATLPAALEADREFWYRTFDEDTENELRQEPKAGAVRERSGRLDAQGDATERVLLPAGLRGRGTFVVTGQVRDISSQVQGQTAVVVVPPDAYLGIGRTAPASGGSGVVTPAVRIVARTPEGAAVAGVAVTLRVRRASQDDEEAVVLHATTEAEPVRVPLPAAFAEGEEVVIMARAADAALAIVPGQFLGLAVPQPEGPETAASSSLTLDRAIYRPGDRAQVTIASPVPGVTALLTLERGGVIDARVVRIDGTTATVEMPVGESAIAGLRLAVTLIHGRRSSCCDADRADPGRPATRSDEVEIVLDQSDTKLAVAIEAPARARPGGRVPVRVRVRDAANRPVSGEVTVWAVDEGLLALSAYRPADPQRDMYAAPERWIWGDDTRRLLLGHQLPPWLGNRLQTSSAAMVFVPGPPPPPPAQMSTGEAGIEGTDARRDFRPLAFWHAAVATDADGVAEIDTTLPDTLTTYRIMAIAADTAARYGAATAPLTVAKPVMTRPAVPRTLTRFDRASIRATVAASGVSGAGTVTLESLTPALLSTSTGPGAVHVDDGGRAVAAFDVEARGEGVARVRIIATVAGERDVVERTIAIVDRSVAQVSAAVGAAAPDAIETVQVPAGIELDKGSFDLELASTMLVGLKAASRYVVQYPYECAEQMASRALALVLQSVLESNGAATPPGGHGGPAARQALAALEAYRCPGGYGYWTGRCEGKSPYLAAYILFVRQTAARHGHAVDAASLARDSAELEALLKDTAKGPEDLGDDAWRAFAAKVLADGWRRPEAAVRALYARRDRLPVFALAHLLDAQAALDAISPRVLELRRQIRNALTVGATAHVEERQPTLFFWCWPSKVKSTAIVLDVLSRRGGLTAEEAGPLVRWLLGARRSGIWSGTQENVWALASLAAYRQAFEAAADGDVTATVTLAHTELLRGTLTPRQPTASARLSMPELQPIAAAGGAGRLAIRSAGAPVYYATRLGLWRPARDAAPLEHGIVLRRRYVPVVGGVDGPEATSFQAGDLVRVVLTVRIPESRTFVAVTDALPGGFEAVDTSLPTAAPDAAGAGATSGLRRWRSGFDRIERYDDRVDLFATSLPAGEHVVTYLARATTPGTFLAGGTRAEAMYEPEVAGRTAAATITVRP